VNSLSILAEDDNSSGGLVFKYKMLGVRRRHDSDMRLSPKETAAARLHTLIDSVHAVDQAVHIPRVNILGDTFALANPGK
jgi:hypothetical protein